jgi:hypothetical protein
MTGGFAQEDEGVRFARMDFALTPLGGALLALLRALAARVLPAFASIGVLTGLVLLV